MKTQNHTLYLIKKLNPIITLGMAQAAANCFGRRFLVTPSIFFYYKLSISTLG